jgi:hypothetical protein
LLHELNNYITGRINYTVTTDTLESVEVDELTLDDIQSKLTNCCSIHLFEPQTMQTAVNMRTDIKELFDELDITVLDISVLFGDRGACDVTTCILFDDAQHQVKCTIVH